MTLVQYECDWSSKFLARGYSEVGIRVWSLNVVLMLVLVPATCSVGYMQCATHIDTSHLPQLTTVIASPLFNGGIPFLLGFDNEHYIFKRVQFLGFGAEQQPFGVGHARSRRKWLRAL